MLGIDRKSFKVLKALDFCPRLGVGRVAYFMAVDVPVAAKAEKDSSIAWTEHLEILRLRKEELGQKVEECNSAEWAFLKEFHSTRYNQELEKVNCKVKVEEDSSS